MFSRQYHPLRTSVYNGFFLTSFFRAYKHISSNVTCRSVMLLRKPDNTGSMCMKNAAISAFPFWTVALSCGSKVIITRPGHWSKGFLVRSQPSALSFQLLRMKAEWTQPPAFTLHPSLFTIQPAWAELKVNLRKNLLPTHPILRQQGKHLIDHVGIATEVVLSLRIDSILFEIVCDTALIGTILALGEAGGVAFLPAAGATGDTRIRSTPPELCPHFAHQKRGFSKKITFVIF